MPYCTFFDLATGLSKPLTAPQGTLAGILAHVEWVEKELGLETEQYQDNPPHWKSQTVPGSVDDETACRVVSDHNGWVRWFYSAMARWQKEPPEGGETITPEDARRFWHGLARLTVPPERWTRNYYAERMEALYEVMRGRETDGVSFGARALSVEQADAVVTLVSEFLDTHDARLAVPEGRDHLTSEYAWCSLCGAIADDDIERKVRYCRRKGGCDVRKEYKEKLPR